MSDDVKRSYRQRVRAERTAATRMKIVEAAVELHGSVGPARTTISAVAERAGVSRPTVYAHFASEAELFQACTMHWLAQDPPPDVGAWAGIPDPTERVDTALMELYEFYARNEAMTENVFRDMYHVASMRAFNVPLVESTFAAMANVLADGFGSRDQPRRRAAVALALSFATWQLLCRQQGMDASDAARFMANVVNGAC